MKEQQNMDFADLEQYIREHWIPSENEEKPSRKEGHRECISVKDGTEDKTDAKKQGKQTS